MTSDLTRGERNNNPGNLNYMEHGAFNGQVGIEEVPPYDTYTARFGHYQTFYLGDRAAMEQMVIDVFKHGLTTAHLLIHDETFGWAPAVDHNDPDAYEETAVDHTCHYTAGFTGDTDLTSWIVKPTNLAALAMGMYFVENGREPVTLNWADHITAAQSALAAQGRL